MGHSDRDAVLIFYAWTAVVGLAVLLMYIGTQEDWPGEYLIGVAFGVVGVAACLAVTLLPSAPHPSPGVPAHEPQSRHEHADPPHRPGVVRDRRRRPRRRLRRRGFLVGGAEGLGSGLLGVVLSAVFLAITAGSILIANRWFGDALYVPIFFGIVLGGWILKLVVFVVALLAAARPAVDRSDDLLHRGRDVA